MKLMEREERLRTFEGVLQEAWSLLERGAADAHAGMHHPVIATRGLDDLPNARIVLLWRFEREHRTLYFGTDVRSPKYAELARTPWALFVGYEPSAQTQLRLHLHVGFRPRDELTHRAWAETPAHTRRVFATPVPPGHEAPAPVAGPPSSVMHRDSHENAEGLENFGLLEARVLHLDWLYMPPNGHRRAAFTWASGDTPQVRWLYP